MSKDSFCHGCQAPVSRLLVDDVDGEVDAEPSVKLEVDEAGSDERSFAVNHHVRPEFLVKEQGLGVDDLA